MAGEKKEKTKKRTTFTTLALVGLLVVAAFLMGTMWSKKGDIEKKQTKQGEVAEGERSLQFEVKEPSEEEAGEKEAVQKSPVVEQPAVLGEEQVAAIGGGGVSKGEEDVAVTIVEFSDFLCSYCAEYAGADAIPQRPIDQERTYQKIMDQYVKTGKVRYVFKQFPAHGELAQKAAEASLCAHDQGKFWEYHDLLFANFGFKAEDLPKLARQLGLDENDFSQCLEVGKFKNQVIAEYEEGKEMARVTWDLGLISHESFPKRELASLGTPTFFINGQMVIGAQPFDNFKKIIEEELKK